MRKKIFILALSILSIAFVTSCQQSKDKSEEAETSHEMDSTEHEQMAKVQYTCTMHPEVVKDEPGKCPKCGMDLVKKESSDGMESDSADHDHQH